MERDPGDDAQWAFAQKREAHDVAWARAFWASLGVAAVAGGAAWATMNPKFNTIFSDASVLGDSTHCTVPGEALGTDGRALLASSDPHFQTLAYVREVLWILFMTAGATVGLAIAYLQLFRRAPKVAIYGSITLMCACYLAGSFAASVITGAIACGLCLFILWWVVRAQARLDLVARLLSIASEGLAANPMVGPLSLGLNGAFFIAAVPFGAAIYAASGNGSIVANSSVAHHSQGQCFTERNENGEWVHVPCCTWQVAPSGWAVIAIVTLVALWTRAVFAQIRTYTIAGSITQWYFFGHTQGNTMLSLRHATTSGFGSICFAAVIITICDIVRYAAQRIRNNRYGQVVAAVFACLFAWLINLLQEFIRAVTNFATVQMAATGEPFLPSSRSVLALLVRNGMKSFTVWWLPNFVLNLSAYAIAGLWWLIVAAGANAVWNAKSAPRMAGDAVLAGFFAFLLVGIVLLYMGGILKNIVDTLYICYARDLDSGTVTKEEVHAAYRELPKPEGAVVVQPDDAVVYGALEEGGMDRRPRESGGPTPLLDEA